MELSVAKKLANRLIKKISFLDTPSKRPIKIVGSILRREKQINDIDLLAIDADLSKINLSKFEKNATKILSGGKKRLSLLYNGIRVDIFTTAKKDLPFALFHYTGSKSYNIRIRAHVKRMGYLLNQYGLFRDGKKIELNIKSERDLTRAIGVSYRVPSNRT